MNDDDTSLMMNQIYEEIIKNRKELRNAIEASEARVLLKLEHLNNKVTQLENENQELKNKIERLETHNKKNNIVIFGLDTPSENISVEHICQELKRLLNIEITETDINCLYPLGKSTNRPIKIEFVTYIKKKLVLQNCNKLKGTNIRIAHDLTYKQRQENRILKAHLIKAKENPANKCFLKGNKLCINNVLYTLGELEEIEEYTTLHRPSSSAPSTPVRNIQQTAELCEQTVNKKNQQSEANSEKVKIKQLESEKKYSQPTPTSSIIIDANKGKSKIVSSVVQPKGRTRSTNK